jgi:hypothetical protein
MRGPRPKSGKWRLNLHDTILEEKSIGLNQMAKHVEITLSYPNDMKALKN